MKTPPNGPFYLGTTPIPNDRHKYNAFGIRSDFGKAYRANYQKRRKRHPRKGSTKRLYADASNRIKGK